MSEERKGADLLNSAIDRALAVADGLAERRVAALRLTNPDKTPAQLITALEREFTVAVSATGAGTGLVAAAPAVGTLTAIAVSGADLAAFMTQAAAHAFAVARIHGSPVKDIEYQRALLMGVLLGSSGSKVVLNAAGHTGVRWGQAIAQSLPIQIIRELNRRLGGLLLKRFAPRAGWLTVLKAVPLGIGAVIGGVSNLTMAREVVRSTREAFGEAPETFAESTSAASEATGDESASDDSASDDAAADDAASDDPASDHAAADDSTPDDSTPDGSTPDDSTPDDSGTDGSEADGSDPETGSEWGPDDSVQDQS